MHPNAARTLHLLYRTENALSPGALLADPFLTSRLAIYGGIPVSDLLTENSIIQMNAEQDELIQACKRSRHIFVMPKKIDGQYFLLPGYYIDPSILVLKNIQTIGTIQELTSFVTMICGSNSPFKIFMSKNTMDYYVQFESREDCFMFWRSIKYTPFKGVYIQSQIYSDQSYLQKPPPKQPVKGPTVEKPVKSQQGLSISKITQSKNLVC